jgi:hypothetical protein
MYDTSTVSCFRECTQATAPFNGAVKSKNEIYFQIASVFKVVTRDETRLTREWTHRILTSCLPENTGKLYVNGL